MLHPWPVLHALRTAGAALLALAVRVPRKIVGDTAARIVGQSEMRNTRDVLQHAIGIARDGMVIFDSDLRLVAWNRAYVTMFQLPPELIRPGVTLDSLIRFSAERGVYGPGEVDHIVTARIGALITPTEGQRIHHVLVDRVFEMRSVRLQDGGLFFTYTDATAQAKTEEELEAENITLERRVKERTEELQSLNFEFARAKAEAEDANISKTRFLAAASHDLLQPLNAARLYTTVLREQLRAAGNETSNRLVTHVDASLEAVEDIIGALLEITHLDAGATQTEITAFPIGGLITQLAIEFEPLARKRGLSLKAVASSAIVLSDRKLLRRLLQNLVSNAIKYTREGRVLIGVRHVGWALRLEVHDTGIGICETKQKLIFREFARLPEAVDIASGIGLGLSIVERLSHVLDHEMSLISEAGKGSVFRVTVPCVAGPVAPVTVSAPSFLRQRPLSGLIVAAIENEADVLAGMTMLLKGWDCVVVAGADLPAIEAALTEANLVPDVIAADFHIGDVDGLGIIAALRQRYGELPAVLITADRAAVIRDDATAADVRVLNKPLKPAALRSLLSQWRLVKKVGTPDHRSVEKIGDALVEADEDG